MHDDDDDDYTPMTAEERAAQDAYFKRRNALEHAIAKALREYEAGGKERVKAVRVANARSGPKGSATKHWRSRVWIEVGGAVGVDVRDWPQADEV